MRCAIADVLLKLPLFKIIFQWMGCVSAGEPNPRTPPRQQPFVPCVHTSLLIPQCTCLSSPQSVAIFSAPYCQDLPVAAPQRHGIHACILGGILSAEG